MTEAHSAFKSVTYIRTTPAQLWEALTTPAINRRYWFGMALATDWKAGSPWRMVKSGDAVHRDDIAKIDPDGGVIDTGEIVEIEPEKHIRLSWRNEWRPELKEEGFSRCRIEIEPAGQAVKLTIAHSIDKPRSKLVEAVSEGWPLVTSNLKSLLETGAAVMT